MSTEVVEVRIWGATVGAVALDPTLGYYAFEYDPAWIRRGIDLAPFKMPVESAQTTYVFPALSEETFKRLPGMLADALPDKFGNALINAWMAAKGVEESSITALDRLAYMGRRGLGALEFRPALGSTSDGKVPLEMKGLVETARDVVHGNFAGEVRAKSALANIIKVGTSAGGARAKAVIAWNPITEEIRGGQFDIPNGFEHWLLKFDGVGADLDLGTSADYGRIEYAYYLMATKGAGINMSACRLMQENGRAHFMTRRFDRDGNKKHHLQSLCALLHLDYNLRGTHSYEQYFVAIRDLGLADDALREGFRRMAFNVMARNCDDHTKNFGFLLKQGGKWELSPAYDVTHAHNPASLWTRQHLTSVNGKFDGITRADLLGIADRFLVPNPKAILDQTRAAIERWPQYAQEAEVPLAKQRAIKDDFQLV